MVLTDQCNFLHQNGRGQLRMGVYIYADFNEQWRVF